MIFDLNINNWNENTSEFNEKIKGKENTFKIKRIIIIQMEHPKWNNIERINQLIENFIKIWWVISNSSFSYIKLILLKWIFLIFINIIWNKNWKWIYKIFIYKN